MSLAYIGSMTVGAAVPGAMAKIGLLVPDLQAQVDALVAFSPGEISLAANLALAEQIVLDLKAAIQLGVTPPSISAQLAIVAAQLGVLRARLELITGFTGLMATAGLHAYSYTGQANQLGPQLSTELTAGLPGGQPTDQVAAVIFAANAGVTVSAMGAVFVGL